MNERILFIDDDPQLLSGIQRRYAGDFDLETAMSGNEGLEAIRTKGPYAVVITDMRMPGMDGLQFLKSARKIAADTTFIMLTGNQDLPTATNALNEGHVFRFLTKPCQGPTLLSAVRDGIERYNLLIERRELLHSTFAGSIQVLTEVLELSHPMLFSQAHMAEEYVIQLANSLGLEEKWEYKIAIRLSRLGAAVLHVDDDTINHNFANPERHYTEAQTGMRLLKHIPRLSLVAEMIGKSAKAECILPTSIANDDDIIAIGAALIRTAWFIVLRFAEGLNSHSVAIEFHKEVPSADDRLITAIRRMKTPSRVVGADIAEVRLDEINHGMILAEEVRDETGILLLAKGARLSFAIISRLKKILGDDGSRVFKVIRDGGID